MFSPLSNENSGRSSLFFSAIFMPTLMQIGVELSPIYPMPYLSFSSRLSFPSRSADTVSAIVKSLS